MFVWVFCQWKLYHGTQSILIRNHQLLDPYSLAFWWDCLFHCVSINVVPSMLAANFECIKFVRCFSKCRSRCCLLACLTATYRWWLHTFDWSSCWTKSFNAHHSNWMVNGFYEFIQTVVRSKAQYHRSIDADTLNQIIALADRMPWLFFFANVIRCIVISFPLWKFIAINS